MKNLIFALLLCASIAYAGPSDILLQEGPSSFMARANAATDGKVYSSKTNPAGLVLNNNVELALTLNLTSYDLEDIDRNPQGTIASGITRDNYKASEAKSVSQYSIGLTLPLSNKLVFGLSAFMPAEKLLSIYSQTSNESNYLHYNDRSQRPEVYLAGGYELNDHFSIGAGIYLSMKATGVIQMGVSNNDAETRSLIEAKPVLIPYIGSLYQNNGFLVGLSYRMENEPETALGFQLRQSSTSGSVNIDAESELVALYDPAQVTLGFGIQKETYESYLSLERIFWSEYKPAIIDLKGDVDTLTNGGIAENKSGFEDTWSIRLGHQFKNLFELFGGKYTHLLGLEFHQGASKDGPESIAVIDTNKWGVSTGFELGLNSLGTFIPKPVVLNFGIQYTSLKKQTFSAINKSNQTQSISAGGSILGVAGGFSIEI